MWLLCVAYKGFILKIVKVDTTNHFVYENLYQGYGAEFSQIIDDKPNEQGLFEIYSKLGGNITGYLLYIDGILTAILEKSVGVFEICDFYVVPVFRKNNMGKTFISALFRELKGSWEIKQVAGADHAVKFWRNVVMDHTSGNFIEDNYLDDKWGWVTRQRFNTVHLAC